MWRMHGGWSVLPNRRLCIYHYTGDNVQFKTPAIETSRTALFYQRQLSHLQFPRYRSFRCIHPGLFHLPVLNLLCAENNCCSISFPHHFQPFGSRLLSSLWDPSMQPSTVTSNRVWLVLTVNQVIIICLLNFSHGTDCDMRSATVCQTSVTSSTSRHKTFATNQPKAKIVSLEIITVVLFPSTTPTQKITPVEQHGERCLLTNRM